MSSSLLSSVKEKVREQVALKELELRLENEELRTKVRQMEEMSIATNNHNQAMIDCWKQVSIDYLTLYNDWCEAASEFHFSAPPKSKYLIPSVDLPKTPQSVSSTITSNGSRAVIREKRPPIPPPPFSQPPLPTQSMDVKKPLLNSGGQMPRLERDTHSMDVSQRKSHSHSHARSPSHSHSDADSDDRTESESDFSDSHYNSESRVKGKKKKARHQCRICHKSFASQRSLKNHSYKHSGHFPYRCPYCGKGAATKQNHNRHLKTHSGQKKFRCSYCHTAFSDRSSFTKHESKCYQLSKRE